MADVSQISIGSTTYDIKDAIARANSLPSGGTSGQVLTKGSPTSWQTPHYVPAGGSNGQVLAKNSATDYDVGWVTGGGGGISLLDVYPVGSIYMSVNSTDPGMLFGGSWTPIQDTFLLAAGTSWAAGTSGGDAEVTLTAAQSGIPAHTHDFTQPKVEIYGNTDTATGSAKARYHPTKTTGSTTYDMSVSGGAVGAVTGGAADASAAHNNMPPYLAVYVWQRVS